MSLTRPRATLRRRVATVVAAVLVPMLLTGCGAAGQANPEEIGPHGVDELLIPTPDPDPEDFVEEVDNPWLPLAPGTVWTYDVLGTPERTTGQTTGQTQQTLQMRVERRRETVAGVECVVVHTGTTDPVAASSGVLRFYAQDRSGNVWLFGERPDVESVDGGRSWMAGENGAMAGIAMLAAPRVGDGYLHQRAPGVADRSTVLRLDEERTVPAGTFGGLLVTEDTSTLPDADDHVVQRAYATGIGLVEEVTTSDGNQRLVLEAVRVPEPDR